MLGWFKKWCQRTKTTLALLSPSFVKYFFLKRVEQIRHIYNTFPNDTLNINTTNYSIWFTPINYLNILKPKDQILQLQTQNISHQKHEQHRPLLRRHHRISTRILLAPFLNPIQQINSKCTTDLFQFLQHLHPARHQISRWKNHPQNVRQRSYSSRPQPRS